MSRKRNGIGFTLIEPFDARCLLRAPLAGRWAFTLVELLVVVAIIMLLAAMLLPSLKNARSRARDSICLSNMRQIGVAVMLYIDAYNGYLPAYFAYCGGGAPWPPCPGAQQWYQTLPALLGQSDLIHWAPKSKMGMWTCPSTEQSQSYSINLDTYAANSIASFTNEIMHINQVYAGEHKIIFSEAWNPASEVVSVNFWPVAAYNPGCKFNWRHTANTIEALMMDGHAQPMKQIDLPCPMVQQTADFWLRFKSKAPAP